MAAITETELNVRVFLAVELNVHENYKTLLFTDATLHRDAASDLFCHLLAVWEPEGDSMVTIVLDVFGMDHVVAAVACVDLGCVFHTIDLHLFTHG